MSIRSAIRAVLACHADGRTLEELDLEYEPAVVALELARLRKEGFIRSTGLRESRPVYVIATWPQNAEEPDEPIAPVKPPQRHEEDPMDAKAKVLKAIEAGPKRRGELEGIAKGKLDEILEELIEERKIVRKGHGRGTNYALRINGAPPAQRPPQPAAAGKGLVAHGYTIETGIPVPPLTGPNSPLVQALLVLEVGQSVVHTNKSKSAICSKPVKATGRRFTSRAIDGGKFRIWRIS